MAVSVECCFSLCKISVIEISVGPTIGAVLRKECMKLSKEMRGFSII